MNDKRGYVIRPAPYAGEGFHLMNSTDPARMWDTKSIVYPTLEKLCEERGLILAGHYDNASGEYWRATDASI